MRPLHLYVATILIWGSTWYAIKMQLGSVEPLASVTYRFILAAIILMGWCHIRALPLRFDLRAHAGMMLLGLFLFSTNYAVFYYATGYVTTGLVAMVFSTIIIMNIVGGAIFLSNRITRTVAAGALTGTVGIFLVFLPDLDTINGFGIMLCLLGTVLASAGNLISASNQRRGIPVVQANAWGMTYGALFLTVTLASSGVPVTFEWSIGYVTSLVYLALFGSVVAFGCYLTLIGRVGPERAAYATVLFPIVALLISTVLEDYHWSTTSIAGALLVLAGNFLVTRRKPAPP
jgi:drug/metabolite transporter (DMT)-like permease